jgi:hypothetical protein
MPLDPAKLQQVLDRGDQLTKRFDALTARRAKRDADKAQRKVLRDAEEALKTSKPEAPPAREVLIVDPNMVPQHPWYDDAVLAEERRELRTGALSKERI